ncbi:PIR protein [Plasmodium vivax]|uniref:VIR protein n=1 Tax=Plasmodium vivax TaxID=5855 RepID=A0A564ZNT3_PLAVI|nr:PIR protein [Plasmodium vivax]
MYALEKAAEVLKLKTYYDDFFSKNEQPKSADLCKIFDTQDKKKENEKKICLKLVRHLEKIGEITEKPKRDEHCNYLTYWFYDELGEIYKDYSKKKEDISSFNDLIGVVNKVNVPQSRYPKCTLKSENGVSLDEWKKRKISYIYFKKHNDISTDIAKSPSSDKCEKYFTYLNYINSFYSAYNSKHCGLFTWPPNYFVCDSKLNPKDLLSTVEKCKTKDSGGGSGSFILSIFGIGSRPATSSVNKQGAEAQRTVAAAGLAKDKGRKEVTGDSLGSGGSKALSSLPKPETANRGHSTGPQQQTGLGGITQPRITVSTESELTHRNNDGSHSAPGIEQTKLVGTTNSFSNFFEKTSAILKSEYFRHSIVGASIIGVLVFLYFFFKSTPIGSQTNKGEKKKRRPQNNYYDEYEEELPRYESQQSLAESQMSDAYISYQPT